MTKPNTFNKKLEARNVTLVAKGPKGKLVQTAGSVGVQLYDKDDKFIKFYPKAQLRNAVRRIGLTKMPKPDAKTAKAAQAQPRKVNGSTSGSGLFVGKIDKSKKIYKLVTANPRKAGTFGHKSFSLIISGMTINAYREKGGRMNDLRWDLDHKYVELRA